MSRGDVAKRMADAAATLLASLDAEQLALAAWPFPAEDERRRWFYTPTDHGGLTLHAMRPAQQQMTMRLLRSGLSRPAYVTATTIIGLENVLDESEGWSATFDRERGRDPGMYYVRVFGRPGDDGPWAWRFGGHHVSVNHTVVDGEVVASTPCFLGANPASSPLLGPHLLRPLAAAEDLGRQLVRSLGEEQLAQVLISPVAPIDLVTANRPHVSEGDRPQPLGAVWRQPATGRFGEQMQAAQDAMERAVGPQAEHIDAVSFTTAPKGMPARLLDSEQREVMRALLDVYVGRVPEELAAAQAATYASDHALDELSFAWAGGLEPGQPHYYRVHGGTLLAEYDNTQSGVNHVHTVWRDLALDFGGDVLADHYAHGHHHG